MKNKSKFQAVYIPADHPDFFQFIAKYLGENPELTLPESLSHWTEIRSVDNPIKEATRTIPWPEFEAFTSKLFQTSQTLESNSPVQEPEQVQD